MAFLLPNIKKINLFLVHVMRLSTGRFFCLSWSENAENCQHVEYLVSMFKQAHSTRRTKRFHSLHRTMLGRFRILAYAALNEKDKEQSQTFHSFSVVQQGFESPATLRLKATSGLTSSWIKHRFDTTLWQNLEIHRCQNHLTTSLCCFHHGVHACVRGFSARWTKVNCASRFSIRRQNVSHLLYD